MQILKTLGILSGLEFGSCSFWVLMVWCDAARTRPVFEGVEWFAWLWLVSGLLMVACFAARLRIVKRLEVKRVAVGLQRGRYVREVVVD